MSPKCLNGHFYGRPHKMTKTKIVFSYMYYISFQGPAPEDGETEGKQRGCIPLRQGHSVQEALLRHPTAGRNGEHDGTERQRTVRRARADDENRLSLWTCLVHSQRGLESMMAGHSKSRCWRTNSNFSSMILAV